LLLNEKAHIMWANPVAAELLGFSREELSERALPLVGEEAVETARRNGMTTQRILLPPHLNDRGITAGATSPEQRVGPVARAFRALLAEEATEAEGEARIPDKNERRVAVHWRLWALPRFQGKPRILFAFSETAQASAEGPITSSYRDIFEYAVEGIYRATIEGRFLEVNPALARMCGYPSPAEMVDHIQDLNVQYYVQPNRRAELLIAIRQGGGSVASFESEVFRADGSVFWSAEFVRVVSGRDGVPLYLEGGVIDISNRKRTEAALRVSEEKFRSLVETTRVVPYEFHAAIQSFVYVGPQAATIFKCPLESRFTLERWSQIVHPDDLREGTRFAEPATANPPSDYQTEFRILASNGEVIWIRQIVHYEMPNSEIGMIVRGFFVEVTEAKKREAELNNSRLQLRELANRLEQVREQDRMSIGGEIHDEVGQALTLLNMDLSWIKARLENSTADRLLEVFSERIASMERNIESAFQTVRRILLSLRPPLLEELGLRDAMEFHLTELAKTAGFRYGFIGSTITDFSIDTKIVVFRIFKELLSNVIKHSKASRVDVQLSESADALVMVVADNGCGFTVEKSKDPRKFGLLGIRERALALGGEVEISSSSGKGTMVTLTIPLIRE